MDSSLTDDCESSKSRFVSIPRHEIRFILTAYDTNCVLAVASADGLLYVAGGDQVSDSI